MQLTGSNKTLNAMLMLAAFTIIVAGMQVASAIIVPILLSVFLAIVSAPPLLWLESKNVPKLIALLVVLSVFVGIGVVLVSLIGASIAEFQSTLPIYEHRLESLFETIKDLANNLGIPLEQSRLLEIINIPSITGALGQVANEIGRILTNVYLIFFTVLFILLEVSTLPEKIAKISAESTPSAEKLFQFKTSIQRYLVIKTIVSLATATLVWTLLSILNVDFAILWAVLAFFLNFVPNIGSIIAAVPAVVIALLQHDLTTAVWVALGYVVINGVIGNVIEPRVAGRHLGLSPLIVFLSLLFWGWVLGPVGMFLSVPLTMMVQLVAQSSDGLKWLAVILSDQVE